MRTTREYDAIVIGGGPAGSSAAISLAQRGARVLVLEEKRMPRGKLCGEFITPECFPSLERLGVMKRMLDAGAQKITRASLIVPSGRSVDADIAEMSPGAGWAMSLSRSRFDQILFERAREAGAECLEGIAVKECVFEDGEPRGVEAMSLASGAKATFDARVIIDASGRNSRLMLGRRERTAGRRGSRLYALKTHLTGVKSPPEAVELFFFPQGYGGLSTIEDGLVNLCFIVDEGTLKNAGDPSRVIDRSLMNNALARERLKSYELSGKWHSAGPLTFGRRRLSRSGVIAIGDASGMIDPFTGTGIQIALRTGEMAADSMFEVIGASLEPAGGQRRNVPLADSILSIYQQHYELEFSSRMNAARLLRAAAFSPPIASLVASVLARAPGLASAVLRATRAGTRLAS